MTIGSSVGSMAALKRTLAKKAGGGEGRITFIPKDPGSLTVRFLQEPEEFIMYEECWDPAGKRSFPYVDGLKQGRDYERKSTVFLANALDVDKDKVIALQVKQTVLNSLVIKFEKYGTLMDRDYEIAKYGAGLDTTYDVTPESPQKRNLGKYDLLDLQKVLLASYNDAMGNDTDTDDDDEQPSHSKSAAGRTRRAKPKQDDDEERPWTETEMKRAEWSDLKEYARSVGVTLKTTKRSLLIEAIMDVVDTEPF